MPSLYVYLVFIYFQACYTDTLTGSTQYVFDNTNGLGRTYSGIGAISGGGATSKLLVNYPEPHRSNILDYLFKPNFGASLQILKVEIGGDAQSSEGTESSHMHNAWDENYERGYEWWLMTEAKKRNPTIKLYGLPWGYPSWLGNGEWWPYRYPNTTASYIIKWIQGARRFHNLTIDYVGIWNEKPYDQTYIKTLKQRLIESGLGHVQIVAADGIGSGAWDIAHDMVTDTKLRAAVDIIGGHYTGAYSSEEAKACGKPLWASEDFSGTADDYGAACIARLLNENYVRGLLSGFVAWNLVAAYYDDLPYKRHSLMVAQQPWSGFYTVAGPLWATAHTTQFTEIGWKYLQNGTGVGILKKGGSYVSLLSPSMKDFTIVIETTDGQNQDICLTAPLEPYRTVPQNVTFVLKGALRNFKELHMWTSLIDLKNGKPYYFKKGTPLKVNNGVVELYLPVNTITTLTTLSKGLKGSHESPPKPAPFPIPYADDFNGYRSQSEAYNFAQQVGVFEVTQTNELKHGRVLRQVLLQSPIHWCPFVQASPLTVIGNYNWSDVKVTVDVRVPTVNASGGAVLAARVDQGGCTTFLAKGVFMILDVANQVVELSLDLARTLTIKQVNFVLEPGTWYTASLSIKGNVAVGTIDGVTVYKEAIKPLSSRGFVALGSCTYGLVDFDNFHVQDS